MQNSILINSCAILIKFTKKMKIENCTISDVQTIENLYANARKIQLEKNAVVWPIFESSAILDAIKDKRQYKVCIDNQIACVFTFTFQDQSIWGNLDKNDAIYIHKIATNANFRGNNLVEKLIDFSRKQAVSMNKSFLRMDTVGQNQGLISYYTKCGFEFLGLKKLENFDDLPAHYHKASVSLFQLKI